MLITLQGKEKELLIFFFFFTLSSTQRVVRLQFIFVHLWNVSLLDNHYQDLISLNKLVP